MQLQTGALHKCSSCRLALRLCSTGAEFTDCVSLSLSVLYDCFSLRLGGLLNSSFFMNMWEGVFLVAAGGALVKSLRWEGAKMWRILCVRGRILKVCGDQCN